MSGATPKRRRTRTIFHYKIDEVLRADDRDNYLALIRHPLMRNEDAHGWLMGRGYRVSLSAVARHRRRLCANDARQRAEDQQTEALARFLGGPGAPDFAAATDVQLQHLVFRHLLNCDQRIADEEDGFDHENGRIETSELLRLSRLVKSMIDLAAARARRQTAGKPPDPKPIPRDDATLRKDINDILAGRK